MPCMYPIPAHRGLATGRVFLGAPVRELSVDVANDVLSVSELLLPCGTCVGCQLSRARCWAVRCSLECSLHDVVQFVTLTFSERYVPPTLSRDLLSRYFRALRDRVRPQKFRFFACGEYGEWGGRPHYHALVFGPVSRDDIEAAWQPRGFVTVEPVTPGRISYTAGYCAKKVGLLDKPSVQVDRSTGEEYTYQPPFLQMSRRPGIGGHARKYWRSWRSHAVWNGMSVPVPRFLHSSYKENASVSELADLEREKLESSMRPTVRSLLASEANVRARVSLNVSGRQL